MTAIARITVSVAALERALPFYEDVLGLSRRYALDGMVMLAVERQNLEVQLHERPPTPGDAGIAVSFQVEDVDASSRRAVDAGATVLKEPADQPWGERQAVLRDPDGHVVCLVAPLEAQPPR